MAKKRDDSGMQSKLMNAAMTAFSRKGLNDCMMHSGYEASAVDDTFSSLAGFGRTVKATLFSS